MGALPCFTEHSEICGSVLLSQVFKNTTEIFNGMSQGMLNILLGAWQSAHKQTVLYSASPSNVSQVLCEQKHHL